MKIKSGSKVMGRKTGKAKMNPESPNKTVNLAKRKRVEDADDLGQRDDNLQGTSKGINLSAVPPILLPGLSSASYKGKNSDSTLT